MIILKETQIPVTPSHIARGERANLQGCPLYLAIREVTPPEYEVYVGLDRVIYQAINGETSLVMLPRLTANYNYCYELNITPMPPHEFTLPIPVTNKDTPVGEVYEYDDFPEAE